MRKYSSRQAAAEFTRERRGADETFGLKMYSVKKSDVSGATRTYSWITTSADNPASCNVGRGFAGAVAYFASGAARLSWFMLVYYDKKVYSHY